MVFLYRLYTKHIQTHTQTNYYYCQLTVTANDVNIITSVKKVGLLFAYKNFVLFTSTFFTRKISTQQPAF